MLATRPRARSEHFAVHLLPGPIEPELSTGGAPTRFVAVDDLPLRVGLVVAKRHARRAVARVLVKRQMRAALLRKAAALPRGLCVVRLRAPFDADRFRSASSDTLRRAIRGELDRLLQSLNAP